MRKENVRVTIAGTDGGELLPELERQSTDKVIVKKRYSPSSARTWTRRSPQFVPTSWCSLASTRTHVSA